MPVREITAILVSWNDAEDVRAAVRSLAEARCRMPPGGPRVSLLVVDNGGGLRDHAGILSPWPGATVLVNEENRVRHAGIDRMHGEIFSIQPAR